MNFENYITEVVTEDVTKRNQLVSQEFLNQILIKKLAKMVHNRTSGKKKLEILPELVETYKQLFRYLNNDYSLETEKARVTVQQWNLNKGLLLLGNFGRGKTLLLDMIFEERQKLGLKGFYSTAYELSKMYVHDPLNFEKITSGKTDLFLDEIGDEPATTLNYGNAENVAYRAMKCFFDGIERQTEKSRLFATTNLGQAEILARYDERIWSRIVGNCNIIVFGSTIKDFRK